MQMGMVDRGADLSWLSQYPHEREVLLPPLTGIEAGRLMTRHLFIKMNKSSSRLI